MIYTNESLIMIKAHIPYTNKILHFLLLVIKRLGVQEANAVQG
jgi:hypothetical protein